MESIQTVWPKTVPKLSEAQSAAREAYMKLWHEELPQKYGAVEAFNHNFSAKLPLPKSPCRTLEIGAGLGAHLEYEDLTAQEYHCLEYRSEFCARIREKLPADRVHEGDIQTRQPWNDHSFDRIIAIHVLEHLPNLPKALEEIYRLLTPNGIFDFVIPCEGGLAHRWGRKLTAERLFRKHFKMDFEPICKSEHVNTIWEILNEVQPLFSYQKKAFFPTFLPLENLNFVAGFRCSKRT